MIVRLNTDLAAGIFGLVFAGVLWLPSGSIGRLSVIFPRAVLFITALLAVGLIIKAFIKPSGREVEIEGSPKRLVIMMLILLVWWYGIGLLGFLVATSIVFFGLTWYLARVEGPVSARRMAQWVPVIALLIGAFYLAFTEVLNVRLPTGFWS